jgi:hypothetical protein
VKPKLIQEIVSQEFEYRGRIRVQLKKEDGSLVSDKFPSRECTLFFVAGPAHLS